MVRPKSGIERKTITTTLKTELLAKLKEINEKEGIPINRLIEVSLEKHLAQTGIKVLKK